MAAFLWSENISEEFQKLRRWHSANSKPIRKTTSRDILKNWKCLEPRKYQTLETSLPENTYQRARVVQARLSDSERREQRSVGKAGRPAGNVVSTGRPVPYHLHHRGWNEKTNMIQKFIHRRLWVKAEKHCKERESRNLNPSKRTFRTYPTFARIRWNIARKLSTSGPSSVSIESANNSWLVWLQQVHHHASHSRGRLTSTTLNIGETVVGCNKGRL